MGLSKKAAKVLDYMQKQGKKDNLEIRLIFGKMATSNGKPVSSGFFDFPQKDNDLKCPILVIGINKKENLWLEILLHEFCHYLQWKNKTKLWKKYISAYKGYKGGKETSKMLNAVVSMEAECEQMTIKLASKIKYKLNSKTYTQKANAYLLFYQIFQEKGKWYKTAPFEQNKIVSQMPNKIIKDPLSYNMSPLLRKLYLNCL